MVATSQSRLAKSIARDYALDRAATLAHLTEALELGRTGQTGGMKSTELSIRELAIELMRNTGGEKIGSQWVMENCQPNTPNKPLLEAVDGVDSTAFLNITGQLIFNEMMIGYEKPEFVFSRVIPTKSTKFNGEKIPGLTNFGKNDDDLIVRESMPVQTVGFSEDYITTPETKKRALAVAITKEAIFFDLTGRIIEQANEVGYQIGFVKERRLAKVVTGITNNHVWRGTSYSTYQSSTPWVNLLGSTELIDWTDIEAAELLFADMVDPDNGQPILIDPKHLVVMPFKRHTARQILNATEVRKNDGASNTPVTVGANPLAPNAYEVLSSKVAYKALQDSGVSASDAKDYWYFGDLSKAFAYMENWPITVVQAPANTQAEFDRDIMFQVKASERGEAAVIQPRAVVKVTKAAL